MQQTLDCIVGGSERQSLPLAVKLELLLQQFLQGSCQDLEGTESCGD
jgi:hypothetical protein